MSLPPPPSTGKFFPWKDYEIRTPTFQLCPIEKPDMSPFLVHLTGKNEITNILEGNGAPDQLEPGFGYLQARIPEQAKGNFDARVVCFTESPTFALDFFRYRSFPRWKKDQRYGIGFDKSDLFTKGARPVIYVDQELLRLIYALEGYRRQTANRLSVPPDINTAVVESLLKMYPLLFPLLEDEERQGYMWEREWRFLDPSGFIFHYQEIRIICCPEDEEPALRGILGEQVEHISFVRTWEEYDDITDYLQRQQTERMSHEQRIQGAAKPEDAIHLYNDLIQNYSIAINSLGSYQELINRLSSDAQRLEQEKERLHQELQSAQERVKELEKRKTEQEGPKKTGVPTKSKS